MKPRIALVCPSSSTHTPYVNSYLKYLGESGCECFPIYWDRFSNNGIRGNVYSDNKIGHRRNVIDYFKYSIFSVKAINKISCDGVVVFGIPLIFMLRFFLAKKFKNKYIVDIRDYHKLLPFFDSEKCFSKAFMVVVSSPKYNVWLPGNIDYVVNHNARVSNFSDGFDFPGFSFPIRIFCIGALKDLDVNIDLIAELKNDTRFFLGFAGEGVINDDLLNYSKSQGVSNFVISGRYSPEEECSIYSKCDIVNMLMSPGDINNNTCLSNRLYNAVINGKPLLCLNGSYISDVVKEYGLGISVDSISDIKVAILNYVSSFNFVNYEHGRRRFLNCVVRENGFFFNRLYDFAAYLSNGKV